MRIRAGFAASPPGVWTIDTPEIVTIEDLWLYIEARQWLPVVDKSATMTSPTDQHTIIRERTRMLNTRLLTTITVISDE